MSVEQLAHREERTPEAAENHNVLMSTALLPISEVESFRDTFLGRMSAMDGRLDFEPVDDIMKVPITEVPVFYSGEKIRHATTAKGFYDAAFTNTDSGNIVDRVRLQFGIGSHDDQELLHIKMRDRHGQYFILTANMAPQETVMDFRTYNPHTKKGKEAPHAYVFARIINPTEKTESLMNEHYVGSEESELGGEFDLHGMFVARMTMAAITGNIGRIVTDIDGKLNQNSQPTRSNDNRAATMIP